MMIRCVRFFLWILCKICKKPNDLMALELCKAAGKFMSCHHQSVYYKNNIPLWNPLYKPPVYKRVQIEQPSSGDQ